MDVIRRVGGALVALFARLLIRLFYRIEVKGNLPAGSGRMLIISNHQSFLDGVILGAFLPISPTYLIHSTIAYRWYFRIPLLFIRHVVVDTTSPLSLKKLIQVIEGGNPVVIFPEGRITVTGSLMKIYEGPAFVAARTGCDVVSVCLDGPRHSIFGRMSGDFPVMLFPKMRMTIHPPVHISMPEGRTAKVRRRKASDKMRRVMQRSQFESRRATTLFDALLDTVKIQGRDRVVLEDINPAGSVPASYKTILRSSLALGRLISKYSGEGENVGVLMPTVNATVFLLFGMWAFRRVPAMLNYTSGAEALSHACRLAGLKVVITSRAFVEKAKLTELVRRLPANVLYLEDLRPQFRLRDKLWLILRATRNPRAVRRPANPRDPALILFTSGSEGMPKGVVLSHDSILANTSQIAAAFPFAPRDKFLSALPLFHSFGLTAGVVLPLLYGSRVVLYPSPLHYRTIPEVVYDRDCTVLFSTNTFLGNYLKAGHPYDFYSLRYVVIGAEKLTEEVARACFEKMGLRPYEGYGATECSPVIAVNTPYVTKMGSVGELLPGIEHRIETVEGISEGGVLHVRGDNVMLGYLGDKGITPPSSEFGEGWYNTGDVATVEDDIVTLTARMKRFAKVGGEMVSLEVVERIALAAKPDSLHASTRVRDAGRGESIVLFTQDHTLQREDLQTAARSIGAPEIAIPRKIIAVDRIPLLGNGKKDYVNLERMAQEQLSAPVQKRE